MVLISIPLGLYTAAKHEGGTADHVVLALNQIIMAVPPFFSGILITLLFGLILHLFTPGGYVSYTKAFRAFWATSFPALAIAPSQGGHGGEAAAQFHCTGNAPGLCENGVQQGNSTRNVMYRHLLKNAMIPVVTF